MESIQLQDYGKVLQFTICHFNEFERVAMKQLSGLDAMFLYLETPNQPMHVGGVIIFQPPTENAVFDFAACREFLASRLHVVRTTRERLINVPFNLGMPYWLEDPNFDIDFHVHHMALPKPGGWKELTKLAGHNFSIPLDRSRPLWEMILVEGLESIPGIKPGSYAIVSKVHHAAIDGASGAEMQGAVLDSSPIPRKLQEAIPWQAEAVPSDQELIKRSMLNAVTNPLELAKTLPHLIKTVSVAGVLWQVKKIRPPRLPFTAPRTRFNSAVTTHRVWDATLFDLAQLKEIKNALEVTLNDVVLAICSGALRKYLADKGELPDRSLTAMLPMNIREEHEKNTQGNKVSALVTSLATSENDLMKRVQKIHKSTTSSKIYHHATDARKLTDLSSYVPYSLGNLAARLYTQMDISQFHAPMYNVIITNVPGPQVPLYMNSSHMHSTYGMAPILDGVGLIIVIQSYAGTISISATSCREIMPDMPVFMNHIRDAAKELSEYCKTLPAKAADAGEKTVKKAKKNP